MSSWGEVTRLAAAQGGCVTRSQLVGLGFGSATVHRRIESGDFGLIAHGVYRLFPANTHADLLRGAVLTLPAAIVSHESAAYLLELPHLPPLAPTVTVASHTTHEFPDVIVRRNHDLDETHVIDVDGLPVTTVARTLFDLAGVLPFREFARVAEGAILKGRTTLDHLDAMLVQVGRRGKPGTRAVRTFLDMRSGGDPKATVLERKGRAVLSNGGLPLPLPEYRFPWDPIRRFDDAYPDAKVAIEWDSREWHAQLEAMTSDRRRDREAASHGWLIVRFTWVDVTRNPTEVVATVATLLDQRRSV
jgi:hypothetical protein